MNKASKTIISVLALAILAGGFFYYKTYIYEEQDISKWKTYQDERYNFEIKYPPHWEPVVANGYLALFYDTHFGDLENNHEETYRMSLEVINVNTFIQNLKNSNSDRISDKDRKIFLDYSEGKTPLKYFVSSWLNIFLPYATINSTEELKTIDQTTKPVIKINGFDNSSKFFTIISFISANDERLYVFNIPFKEKDSNKSAAYNLVVDKMMATFRLIKQ